MAAAYVVGVDKLADEDIVSIKEAVSLDNAGGNADLLAGGVGVRAGERAKSDLGGCSLYQEPVNLTSIVTVGQTDFAPR